ncbi:hypothetical protein OHC33_009618 [Knufia fluminis]|uniref:MARVEL domain-containing protein n=1 Tax=Knufia fluminis TaxID=191047 RepID=A0AAN8I2W0_9EURO|nr:hypothetical protein OHC33_009618 [Knufia fluminis]
MGFRDASGKEKVVLNAIIRLAQFIVAAAALGVYGQQKGYWLDHGIPARVTFELVVGSLAIVTAAAFGLIPFFLSYRPVALGAPWDFILMVLWGAAFGLMKAIFLRSYRDDDDRFGHTGKDDYDDYVGHWDTMERSAYINLAGLALFLISGVMGLVLFFIGRRSSSGGRTKASYA